MRSDVGLPGLIRYWRVIRHHLGMVVACTLIAIAAAVAYTQLATKMYSAEAQMLITPIEAGNSYTIGLPVLHSSADPTRDALTAASLITIPQVARTVIVSLHLQQSPDALLHNVTATPVGQSSLIAIQAISKSPRTAQQIANAFATQVVAVRTQALHRALATVVPGLRAQVAAESPPERSANSILAGELTQLQQLQASPDPTITIASSAGRPAGPFTPKTKLVVIAGLLGGLLIGIAAAFVFDVLDPRLAREEQIRDVLDLRVLARIPRERSRLRWRRRSAPMLPRDFTFIARQGYRTLHVVLTAGGRNHSTSVLVTGSDPGEGKTTTAINLAASAARSGKRVILIEADLRRPTIAAALDLTIAQGTEHVIFAQADIKSALVPVKMDGVTLHVLAVHTPRARLVEQLSSEAAQRLIAAAMEHADFVVIDSPPIAAVVDALPLAEYVDNIVVVARLGVSRLSKLTEMRSLLVDQGSHPSGIVLIGDHPSQRGSDYYYAPAALGQPLEPTPEAAAPRQTRAAATPSRAASHWRRGSGSAEA